MAAVNAASSTIIGSIDSTRAARCWAVEISRSATGTALAIEGLTPRATSRKPPISALYCPISLRRRSRGPLDELLVLSRTICT